MSDEKTPASRMPAPSPEGSLSRYLQEIRKFPMLEPEQEYMLAKRFAEHEDSDAAHQMVTSHLRLVGSGHSKLLVRELRRLLRRSQVLVGLLHC